MKNPCCLANPWSNKLLGKYRRWAKKSFWSCLISTKANLMKALLFLQGDMKLLLFRFGRFQPTDLLNIAVYLTVVSLWGIVLTGHQVLSDTAILVNRFYNRTDSRSPWRDLVLYSATWCQWNESRWTRIVESWNTLCLSFRYVIEAERTNSMSLSQIQHRKECWSDRLVRIKA